MITELTMDGDQSNLFYNNKVILARKGQIVSLTEDDLSIPEQNKYGMSASRTMIYGAECVDAIKIVEFCNSYILILRQWDKTKTIDCTSKKYPSLIAIYEALANNKIEYISKNIY